MVRVCSVQRVTVLYMSGPSRPPHVADSPSLCHTSDYDCEMWCWAAGLVTVTRVSQQLTFNIAALPICSSCLFMFIHVYSLSLPPTGALWLLTYVIISCWATFSALWIVTEKSDDRIQWVRWVVGHSQTAWNEMAGDRARQLATQYYTRPEPALEIFRDINISWYALLTLSRRTW